MGEHIKELRTEFGMTQEELGRLLGVQKSVVGKYEKGDVENIKRSSIQKMAEFFSVSPCYILGFTDDKYNVSSQAINLFNQLDELDKGRIIGQMEEMLRNNKYIKKYIKGNAV